LPLPPPQPMHRVRRIRSASQVNPRITGPRKDLTTVLLTGGPATSNQGHNSRTCESRRTDHNENATGDSKPKKEANDKLLSELKPQELNENQRRCKLGPTKDALQLARERSRRNIMLALARSSMAFQGTGVLSHCEVNWGGLIVAPKTKLIFL
jgi:hypothetical protein